MDDLILPPLPRSEFTNMQYQRRYIGTVYTSDQMREYAKKAVEADRKRLQEENDLLMNALWKACGDDEEVVNATIESQR